MPVEKKEFGRDADFNAVWLYTFANGPLVAKVTNYGGRLTELHVPDRHGHATSIVLGFDNLAGYLGKNPHFGSTIGRVTNRIGHARFTLDGQTYHLPPNENGNTLHSGLRGWDRVLWSAEPLSDLPGVALRYCSPDGEQGFPGCVSAEVIYTLPTPNELTISYTARTTAPTPINLTNHSYFNLGGAGRGNVLDHILEVAADRYTPVGAGQLPTGEMEPVAGTPLDFTKPTPIGERVDKVDGNGIDHNFIINPGAFPVARVHCPDTGRTVEVLTTQPSIQVYTGNYLDGSLTGIGGTYAHRGAFCLETQHDPDAVNHANFPSTILRPGQTYHHVTSYRFSTD